MLVGVCSIEREKQLPVAALPYEWIRGPIRRACAEVRQMPIYDFIDNMKRASDFKRLAEQFCIFSPAFVKAMGVMLANVKLDNSRLISLLAEHISEEANHPQMLRDWMLEQGFWRSSNDLTKVVPTLESESFVNFLLRLGAEGDQEIYLAALNFGIESCSHDFFSRVSKRLNQIKMGHLYFDIHGTVDEKHCSLGEGLVSVLRPAPRRAEVILRTALQGISLWAAALHAPIGIKIMPDFTLEGTLI
jgi:hypothetical protein